MDVGGKPWYGGNIGCGIYTMQSTNDWQAKGWTIGASYCDGFSNESGSYVAVGGWFCGNPVNFFGCFYYWIGIISAGDLRLGACFVIHVVITQCMMVSIEFVSVVTGLVGWLVCFHMHVCGVLPMVLVLVITIGVIFPVSGMLYMVAGAAAERTAGRITCMWAIRLGMRTGLLVLVDCDVHVPGDKGFCLVGFNSSTQWTIGSCGVFRITLSVNGDNVDKNFGACIVINSLQCLSTLMLRLVAVMDGMSICHSVYYFLHFSQFQLMTGVMVLVINYGVRYPVSGMPAGAAGALAVWTAVGHVWLWIVGLSMRTGLLVLVDCDEVNKENSYGLRIFHVGGSTVYVGEFNGVFKMTGVGYDEHAADRFGACDHFESTLSGIRYALSAGGCFWREDCGVSYLSVNDSLEYANLADGACDYFKSNLSDIRYTVTAIGCYCPEDGGATYLTLLDPLWYVNWAIGASYCDHIWNRGDPRMYCMVGSSVLDMCSQCGMCSNAIYHGPQIDAWYIGACDSIWFMQRDPVSYAFIGFWSEVYLTDGLGMYSINLHNDYDWLGGGAVSVGACDYCWSELSDLRYAWCGGICFDRVNCGAYMLNLAHVCDNVGWSVGARLL